MAYAGGCCGTTTTAVPTRPASCDHAVAGVGVAGAMAVGRWDSGGASVPSSAADQQLTGQVGVGARWAPWGFATAAIPVRFTHRAAGALEDQGGGVGDLLVAVGFQPMTEQPEGRWPAPVFSFGLQVPTGRDWQAATGVLTRRGRRRVRARCAPRSRATTGTPPG